MKNVILIFLVFNLILSCTSYEQSKNISIKKSELAHSKFSNLKNDLSYKEYKSLIIEYGKNNNYPDLK